VANVGHNGHPGAAEMGCDPFDAVARLEDQLMRLRTLCGQRAAAQQDFAARAAQVEARERELTDLAQHIAAREQAAADCLADVQRRERELRELTAALAQRNEIVNTREQELGRIRERLNVLSRTLRAVSAGPDDHSSASYGNTLEMAIASAAQDAMEVRREADQVAADLETLKRQAEAESQRARSAEIQASEGAAKITELTERLSASESQRDELERKLRLQEMRLRRAGLEIEWHEGKKPRRSTH
jgi:chromosome segregation ATPase